MEFLQKTKKYKVAKLALKQATSLFTKIIKILGSNINVSFF